jgi:hypothetical protein
MKHNKKYIRIVSGCFAVFIVFLFLSTIAIGTYSKSINDSPISKLNSGDFYGKIEFWLYEGEGCACDELQDVYIFADGQDTDHDIGNYTNYRGYSSLELEIDSTYRISIQDDNYQNVLFDVLIVDDQVFTFHLTKEKVSDPEDLTISKSIVAEPQLFSKAME